MGTVAIRSGASGFRHRVADHAASGALRDLLEHYRASYAPEPLSEGAAFGFSGALDLSVRMAPGAVPVIDIDGRAPSLELDACRHLGLDVEWHATEDPSAGWERLRRELDEGHPVLLRADVAELDYYDERPHDTRHAVVVTGCDVQAGVVWVADRCFADPQRCALSSLAAARASRGWPEPARHGMLRVRRPARLAEPRAAVRAALGRVVGSMRDPQSNGHPYVRSGLPALDRLADAWPSLPAARRRRASARRSPRCASGSATAGPAARCIARCRRASSTTPRRCSDPSSSGARRSSATTSRMPGARSPRRSTTTMRSARTGSPRRGSSASTRSSIATSRRSRRTSGRVASRSPDPSPAPRDT